MLDAQYNATSKYYFLDYMNLMLGQDRQTIIAYVDQALLSHLQFLFQESKLINIEKI